MTKDHFKDRGRETQEIAMASEIVMLTMGPEWWNRNCHQDEVKNYLNTNQDNNIDGVDRKYKIVRFADCLYQIRHCSGFDDYVLLLEKKDFKSCYWELSVAAHFYKNGYKIELKKKLELKVKIMISLLLRTILNLLLKQKAEIMLPTT